MKVPRFQVAVPSKGSKRFPGSKEGLQVKDLGRSTVPSKGSKQSKGSSRFQGSMYIKGLSEGSKQLRVPSEGSGRFRKVPGSK